MFVSTATPRLYNVVFYSIAVVLKQIDCVDTRTMIVAGEIFRREWGFVDISSCDFSELHPNHASNICPPSNSSASLKPNEYFKHPGALGLATLRTSHFLALVVVSL